jgi:hypothetical protein
MVLATGAAAGPDPPLGLFLRTRVFEPEIFSWVWVRTYWMSWGWLDTELDDRYYLVLAASVLLAGVGLAAGWGRLEGRSRRWVVLGLGGTLCAMALLYRLELVMMRTTGAPRFLQGRYLLPLFPLHALLLALGLRSLSRRAHPAVDGGWMFAALLGLVQAAAVVRTILRYYV